MSADDSSAIHPVITELLYFLAANVNLVLPQQEKSTRRSAESSGSVLRGQSTTFAIHEGLIEKFQIRPKSLISDHGRLKSSRVTKGRRRQMRGGDPGSPFGAINRTREMHYS